MTKIITTCLLGAGLMAGATILPQSQAHEGHEGHDHVRPVAPSQDTPQQIQPAEPSNGVVTTPPPFETLDSKPATLLTPPTTTLSDQNSDRREPVKQNSRQPQQRPIGRFDQNNPNVDIYNDPSLNFEDGHTHSHDTADSFDEYPRESYGSDGRGLDRFTPQEALPPRPRFSQSMSERESEFHRGHPSARDMYGYDNAGRYCATETRWPYNTASSCNLADANYQHTYSPRIDFDRTDYRQHRDVFHCPGAIGSCHSSASQFHY